MSTNLKAMMADANSAVPRIEADKARALIDDGALIVDVRDGAEVEKTGKVAGAVHVSRGMLEFRADPESAMHAPAFDPERPVIVYCASGGRAALAGKTLQDLGYRQVYNLGGFKEWAESGGATESVLEPGM